MPAYLTDLITVVKAKGTRDVIEGFKKSDYSTVHSYKGVEVIEDAGGATRIKKGQEKPLYGSDEPSYHEVEMEIRPGEYVKDKKGKMIKTQDEYVEYTAKPDRDGKLKDVDEYIDEMDHLDLKEIADEIDTLVIKKASGGLAQLARPGYQHGSRQPGLETSTSAAKQEAQQQDIRDVQRAMADQGGGDAEAYVREHERIPSPIIKREVQGPLPFEKDSAKKFVYDKLTKRMVSQKFTDFAQQNKKVFNTAERILQALKVDEETYNEALGHLQMKGVTTEYGATRELKDYLAAKGYDISNVPLGPFTGGAVETTLGPLTLEAQIKDDELKYEAALSFENKGPESTSGIGGLTGEGPSRWKEKSTFDKLTKDLSGNIVYDENLAGQLAYDKGIFGTDLNLSDAQWNAFLQSEDEKKKIGVRGIGPTVSGFEGKVGPFTGKYDLASNKYNVGIDQALTESGNLRFKSDYDSDDKWNAGIYGNWTWGKNPNERFTRPLQQEQTETERLLRLNLNKLKTTLNAKGGRVGMGKGGVAHLLGE